MSANKTLFKAAQTNDIDLAKQALIEKANINAYNSKGNTVLIEAIKSKSIDIVKFLLEKGANVNYTDNASRTALHWAILIENFELIKLIISRNALLDIMDDTNKTPLALAAESLNHQIVNYFNNLTLSNYHAEKLALRQNIKFLTAESDEVNEACNELLTLMIGLPADIREIIEPIYCSLEQPEEIIKKDITDISNIVNIILKPDNPIFSKLIEKIKTLDNIFRVLPSDNPSHTPLIKLFGRISNFYKHYINQVCEAYPEKRKELLEGRLRIKGFMGYRYLNAGASVKFNPYLPPENANDDDIIALRSNDNIKLGTHPVIQLHDCFFKIRPFAPAVEHAVDTLNKIITGEGSAPTELLTLERNNRTVPVIASKAINGLTLYHALLQHPQIIEKVDPYNFSAHFVMAILTRPCDGKADNFIATNINAALANKGLVNIIGIDNDMAFEDPILLYPKTSKLAGQHFIEMKTIFFCMSQMNEKMDDKFRQMFLNHTPELIMIKWLRTLLIQEKKYINLRSNVLYHAKDNTIENAKALLSQYEFDQLNLPIKFIDGTIQSIYADLRKLFNLMKNNASLTHQEILNQVMPLIGKYYQQIRDTKSTLLDRYDCIFDGPTFEDLLKDEQDKLIKLEPFKRVKEDSWTRKHHTETIKTACTKFVNLLDYSQLHTSLQGYILERIGIDFNFLDKLIIKNSLALNDERLEILAQRLKKLKTVKLINCSNVYGAGLSALLTYHPDIKIILKKFENLSSYNILTLLQNTKNLTFIFSKPDRRDASDKSLLFDMALKHKQYNLITALLMLGINNTYHNITLSDEPLHIAIAEGYPKVVIDLINYGAPLNLTNYLRKTPLDILLAKYNESMSSQDISKQKNYRQILVVLLKAGAYECTQEGSENSVLSLALKIFKKNNKRDNLLREALFAFACCYNLLTPELLLELLPTNYRSLDFSAPSTFQFYNFKLYPELIDALKNSYQELETLNISGCSNVTSEIIDKISSMKLKILFVDYTQASNAKLINLHNLDEASKLKINNMQIKITHMDLSGNKDLTTQIIKNIAQLVAETDSLKSLKMCNCSLNQESISPIAVSFTKNNTLETLYLNRNPLGDAGVSLVINLIRKHPKLIELNLGSTNIGLVAALTLSTYLKKNIVIENLNLFENPIGDEGIKALAQGLEDNISLKSLVINNVRMTAASVKAVTQACYFHKSLNTLDIGYNELGNQGAEALIQLLQLKTKLYDVKAYDINASEKLRRQVEELKSRNRKLNQAEVQRITVKFAPVRQVVSLQPPEYRKLAMLEERIVRLKRQKIMLDPVVKLAEHRNSSGASSPALRVVEHFKDESINDNFEHIFGTNNKKITLASEIKQKIQKYQSNNYIFTVDFKDNTKLNIHVKNSTSNVILNLNEKLWPKFMKLFGTFGQQEFITTANSIEVKGISEVKMENIKLLFKEFNIEVVAPLLNNNNQQLLTTK